MLPTLTSSLWDCSLAFEDTARHQASFRPREAPRRQDASQIVVVYFCLLALSQCPRFDLQL